MDVDSLNGGVSAYGVDLERVNEYFNDDATVAHYAKAAVNVGLWESERRLIEAHFGRDQTILDLGCGAGRVTFGLWNLGFSDARGADFAEAMVEQAKDIGERLRCPFRFERQDATRLSYEDESFDGVIFAFNGLMQIPGHANRRRALAEILRVLKPGGRFLFSTLDRGDRLYTKVFADAGNFEHDIRRNPNLLDYGDRHFTTDHGTTFMHVPSRDEVAEALREIGFELVEEAMRSAIARESAAALDFSEDCRMWVARKR